MKVLFGGVWHETNSFSPVPTDLAAFRRFQFVEGDALLDAYDGTNTEIGGFVPAASRLGFDLIPTVFAGAVPSGMVARAALDHIVALICDRAKQRDFDGMYLALHGAMVAEGIEEADAYVAQQVRAAIGPGIPLVMSLDLHANASAELVAPADIVVGYKTLPHIDMAERGAECATLLARLMAGEKRPARAFRKLRLITVPQMQATHEEPMREIMAEVAAIERQPGMLSASIVPGFAYADVPNLGMAVMAYGDGAEDAVARLEALITARRDKFLPDLVLPEDAIRRALAAPRGPVILTEPADNVGGGAPGDGTHLLAALLAAHAPATVVIWDPAAAAEAARIGVGNRYAGDIGGHTHPLHGAPVPIQGTVRFAGPVAYRRDSSYMTGQPVDLGQVAVIEADSVKIVVTTERAMPFDTNHLRLAGITPERERIITTKCASAWRHAFGEMAAAQYYVDTAGTCSSNVERMPYTRLEGWYFPLARSQNG